MLSFEDRLKKIRRALSILIKKSSTAELRALGSRNGPQSGLFDNLDEMAKEAARASGTAKGVYYTLNPVKETLRGRIKNRLERAFSAVKDGDIACLRWLFLDFDPIRNGKCPSTDAEHEDALALAKKARKALRNLGWPEPVLADSGNGYHLLFRIDLANDKKSGELVRNVLLTLSLWFSTFKVTLDPTTANPSRLTRAYGTVNAKGDETTDRLYRRSQLLEVPDKIQIVTAEQLSQVAGALPVSPAERSRQQIGVDAWLKKYELPVAFDAPWNDADHKWILRRCPWNDDHVKSAYVVQFADGGVAAGCHHKSCAGKNWPQLRTMFEEQSPTDSPSYPPPQIGAQKRSQTAQLIDLARPNLKLFRTPQGEPYATIDIESRNEHHPVDSSAFRQYMVYKYFRETKTAPQPTAVNQAVSQFGAEARFGDSTESIFIRVGKARGRNYLDLADDRWAAIEFSSDGWRVVEKPPIRFRRVRGMLPLPRPARGGDISDLQEFLNLRTDEDWVLFVTALVNAIFPSGPYPILGINGEAGSGKTTAARVHRRLVDPSSSPARSTPKDERDLMVMANNGWVLSFDNLSFLPGWLSDSFCRLSTGGGISRRSLYTDAEEFIFDGQRPILLNGIDELATRTDLLDRSVLLELPVIRKYVAEKEFWRKFDAAHPQLLGALLDVAVGALQRLPTVKLAEQPRMADFALLGTAAESGLGFPRGTFMRAYNRNRQNANAVALEASPIASHILELAKKTWQGTATELLRTLNKSEDDETQSRRGWPKYPRVLSSMLKRLNTALRTTDVEIEFIRDNNRNRDRMITIRRMPVKGK